MHMHHRHRLLRLTRVIHQCPGIRLNGRDGVGHLTREAVRQKCTVGEAHGIHSFGVNAEGGTQVREHLPDATKSFGASKAWRFWSATDPSLHQAMYQFADQAALDRAMNGEALKTLVAEFDRCWPDVQRSREVLVLAEEFGAG